jgi:hypothetical protein
VGASDGDISVLPRYRYYDPSVDSEEETDEGLMIPILNNSGMSTSERILLREDAVRTYVPYPYSFNVMIFLCLLRHIPFFPKKEHNVYVAIL